MNTAAAVRPMNMAPRAMTSPHAHAVALGRKIVFGEIVLDDRVRSVGTCGHLTLIRFEQGQPLKHPA